MFCASVDSLSGFPPKSNEMQARLTGDFKLLVGMNMSVNDYLSLCVGPLKICPECTLPFVL